MKAFIYTALTVQPSFLGGILDERFSVLNGHITTSFTELNRKLPKIYPSTIEFITDVIAIEYWKEAKVTVARVDHPSLYQIHESLMEAGFEYQYEFKPHITIAHGEDKSQEYQYLIGAEVRIGHAYVGTVVKDDNPSGIKSIIARCNEDDLSIQYLSKCTKKIEASQLGTDITFGTTEVAVGSQFASPLKTGVILWFYTDKLKALIDNSENKTAQP